MSTEQGISLAEEVIKTQELLSPFITHPPLIEKNLVKPPFRFLHDIIINVIEETGFMRGVFTEEELSPSTSFSTDDKRMFLNKLIITAMEATGESTDVRPSKILSGKEPEKTNKLLQIIARGIRLENEAGDGKPKGKKEPGQVEKNKKSQLRPVSKSKSILPKEKNPEVITRSHHKPPSVAPTSITNLAREKITTVTKTKVKPSHERIETKTFANAAGRKSQPAPTASKQQVVEKKPPGKQPGMKINASKEAKSKLISSGSQNKDKTRVEKNALRDDQCRNDDDDDVARVPPWSAILVPPTPVSARNSNAGLRTLRSSSRLSDIAMSKSTSSTSSFKEKKVASGEIRDQRQNARSATKKKSSKTAISAPEHKECDRPVTRAGFPQEDEISIRIEEDYTNPTVLLEDKKEANKTIRSVEPGISGDDESCNNLYEELCNPKATTPTDVSDIEESEIVFLTQRDSVSDVSICKSDSHTSLIATDEEFYRSSVAPIDTNSLGPKLGQVSSISVPEDLVEEVSENEYIIEETHDEQQPYPIAPIPIRAESRPSTARPSTARPPPPSRTLPSFVYNQNDDPYRLPEGQVTSVILDSNPDEREDEAFVVTQVIAADSKPNFSDTLAKLFTRPKSARALPPPELRGYLVDQIITTQEELEVKEPDSFPEKISRDNYPEEIERLKNLIQVCAKNANPIAKLLDYVGEDVHFIEGDLYRYREENTALNKKIELAREERKKTLKPLEKELVNVELKIQDKEDEIAKTKMNILRLEDRIRMVLLGLDRVAPRNPQCYKHKLPSSEEVMKMLNSEPMPFSISSGDFKRNSLAASSIDLRQRGNIPLESRGESGDYSFPPCVAPTSWAMGKQ